VIFTGYEPGFCIEFGYTEKEFNFPYPPTYLWLLFSTCLADLTLLIPSARHHDPDPAPVRPHLYRPGIYLFDRHFTSVNTFPLRGVSSHTPHQATLPSRYSTYLRAVEVFNLPLSRRGIQPTFEPSRHSTYLRAVEAFDLPSSRRGIRPYFETPS